MEGILVRKKGRGSDPYDSPKMGVCTKPVRVIHVTDKMVKKRDKKDNEVDEIDKKFEKKRMKTCKSNLTIISARDRGSSPSS